MPLFSQKNANEQENERRVVNWLGAIALAAVLGAVVLAATASKSEFGIDTAVVVALIGITAQCASSLGTRRTRIDPNEKQTTPTDPPPGGPPLPPPDAPAAPGGPLLAVHDPESLDTSYVPVSVDPADTLGNH